MTRLLIVFTFVFLFSHLASSQIATLPALKPEKDWLLTPIRDTATIRVETSKNEITITNGLVSRTFRLSPNTACMDYRNLTSNQQLLRAVKPEARITLNGKEYRVGGLHGQKQNAYLTEEEIRSLTADPNDFQYESHAVSELKPHVNWKPRLWNTNPQQPAGQLLIFQYKHPDFIGLKVKVCYEIYDRIPLICKYVTIENASGYSIKIDQVVNEILAMPEEESAVVGSAEPEIASASGTNQYGHKTPPTRMKTPQSIYIESNYAFNNAMRADLSDQTTHWKTDKSYTSQVNYDYNTPCLLEVYPKMRPGVTLEPGKTFQSVRTYELLQDSYDRERRGLAIRKMYRTIAPWVTQNPIFMHLISTRPEDVRHIIDQCAETGYEGVILSFGSGLNMEDTSQANIAKFRALADYAHGKGILLGGYSLFSSRKIDEKTDVISPYTGKPGDAFFGNAPCLGSEWGLAYIEKLKYFFTQTGFDIFENDGPYPGDVCASTTHPGHAGLEDSQWKQMELQKEFYRWCNERGIYINAPDWYFLDGTHKIGLGYREVNFSLPREEQQILNRQNIFDGTWEKTPSMGWGFVPLTEYQGGGAAAVLEPLSEHLDAYKKLMIQYYGAGIQACYRGPRLYDTEETKQVVKETIDWYKKYRSILNADIIHLRRPDGRDWDGILHVDPAGKQKAFVLLYNPLKQAMERTISLPLYYSGLNKTAKISIEGTVPKSYSLSPVYTVELKVSIPAEGYTWAVLE